MSGVWVRGEGAGRSWPCGVEERRRGPQRAVWSRGEEARAVAAVWGRREEARAAAGREVVRAAAGRAILAEPGLIRSLVWGEAGEAVGRVQSGLRARLV